MYDTFGNYFKKSFHLIFQKPILFVPTLINLVITIAFIIGVVASIWVVDIIDFPNITTILLIILGILIMFILELLVYAGNYNMIKQAVTVEETTMDDFWSGAKKYGGRIILGWLIVIGVILLALLIFIVPAIFSKSFGLMMFLIILLIIPVIVLGIFISFWETILVYEDCDIMKAFKLSFSFAKKHFGLVFVITLLQGIFTVDRNSNKNNSGSINLPFHSKHGGRTYNIHAFGKHMPFAIGTIGIISIIITIIKAFLTLYFDVIFFVIYHDRRESIFNNDTYE